MSDNSEQKPSSIKLHVFRMEMGNHGTDSCDFRGSGEHGAGEDDQHRTVAEIEPAPAELVDLVLADGPSTNQLLQKLGQAQPEWADQVAGALGLEGSGPVGLRVGIWDH